MFETFALTPSLPSAGGDLLAEIDQLRLRADASLSAERRAERGQFMTPAPIARYMAALFENLGGEVRLLDPGAGVGSLTAAFVGRYLAANGHGAAITADAFELYPVMLEQLATTLATCRGACNASGVAFHGQAHAVDFVEAAVQRLREEGTFFAASEPAYTHCIMNPPYRKIQSSSAWRQWLQQVGIETSNLYSAFLALAVKLLAPGGELVAIVPRSFCNGVYFRPFRHFFLREMALTHLHVFEARDQAFKDNQVLQENIILRAVKGGEQGSVAITASFDAEFEDLTWRAAEFAQVVRPDDPDQFINIATTDSAQLVLDRLSVFTSTLDDLGLSVSTGPVVDFRLRHDLRPLPESGAHPLIYPAHFSRGFVSWPKPNGRKPNAIAESDTSRPWLMPNGWYVLTRRFSAKEEKRRIVAAIHEPSRVPGVRIGFENHLNVFHEEGKGLDPNVAKGLALYLNSTLVDLYFRQFSGHTQVNAADLRSLHYPSLVILANLGAQVSDIFPDQIETDLLVNAEILTMTSDYQTSDPVQMQRKIQEALAVLGELGVPKAQRNERSALTLLALLGLKSADLWLEASSPLMGITPIMDFVRDHYGRTYAPNTRETFRRFTMHQFVQAGIATMNPDHPDRPINSPKWVYQISPAVLELVRSFGHEEWKGNVGHYLKEHRTLAAQYARVREMSMVPLVFKGERLTLSPGAHSQLIKAITEDFGPRFVPGAEVLYVGDTGAKMAYFDGQAFQELGLAFDAHGKFPDVILYYREENWLLLIEAVTSHGPVNPKRHAELQELFASANAGLVYVTAFPDQPTFVRYSSDISWETEVWLADHPTHMIHFDGETFLGPH